MQFRSRTVLAIFLAASATLSSPQWCSAEPVNGRPGLWVQAIQLKFNGSEITGIMGNPGDLKASEKASIKRTMKKYGLPESWNPVLKCMRKADFEPKAAVERAAQNCPGADIKLSGSGATYSGQCSPDSQSPSVTGETQLVSNVELREKAHVQGSLQGQPMTTDMQSISKWVAEDCTKPPFGFDPSWRKMMIDLN
jgi:hypothetical protein